jgi:PAS domain S-box-containing protein
MHLRHYVLAVLSVGIALGAALLLQQLHFRVPAAPLLLFAVAISSWYGGTGPAVLAVALSMISFYWFFVEPVRTIYIYPSDIPFFIIFVGFAALLSWFGVIRRRDEKDLRDQAGALRASEAYLAEAQRLSHTGSWALDVASDKYAFWSDEMFRIYGFDPKEALPTRESVFRQILPEYLNGVEVNFRKSLREKVDTPEEYRIMLGDGTVKHIHIIRHPVLNEGGDVVQLVGTAIDITERKRTEEALRQSEAYLAESQRLTHTGSWALNVVTREYDYWSEEMFRIFGADPQQGVPPRETMARRIHPEDRDRVMASFEKSLREKVDTSDEYRFVLPEGTIKHIQVIRHPVRNDAGELVKLVGTFIDITERKRAEEALRRSEAYLTEAQRLSRTGSWALDLASDKYAYVSEECLRIYGFDPQGDFPTREAVFRRIHPEDFDRVKARFEKSLREKVDSSDELRIVLPDRTVKHLHVIRHPVLNGAGDIVELVGTSIDITERKRAEEALRDSETLLRTFVDHAADAFFMLDFEQGTIIDVNRRACESLGYTQQELIGMTPLAFDMNLDRATLESVAERTAAGETVLFDTHWHRRKDGSLFPVEIQTSTFWYRGRHFLLKVARDISEHVRAEEQRERLRELEADLAHINRVSMLGELAASIAHEVNQPLSGIVSNASASLRFLAGDAPNVEEAREAARDIVRDGKRAGAVIARIRALTKRTAAPRERLDLNETIQEVLALVSDEAKRNSVIVRTHFADHLSPVAGDRVQLQQVILNLVLNSIEAMSGVRERARQLVITTRNVEPGQVQATVEDSGRGLDPNTIGKIFDPFYSTKSGGMGMGLSISRSIIEAHGGRLWPTANDGSGTSFHFSLPKCQEESNGGI